jgi:ATP-dependent RNA helicase DDX20
VLDESDKLLESGQMAKDVTGILKLTVSKVQIIAATATVSSHMEKVLKQFMRNPVGITPKHEVPVLLGIKQFVHVLPREADNIKLMKMKIAELQKIFDRIT